MAATRPTAARTATASTARSSRYLAANVTDKQTKLPILLPFAIEFVDGVPVGFVGMTLEGTPSIVNPAGITTVDFRDEVETANFYAKLLGFIGIRRSCS